MNRSVLLFLTFFSLFFFPVFCGIQEYTEPQDVATTEGLPTSLVNRAVCAITGEYTDSITDVVIPGPEPLIINRVYTSSSGDHPWSFNHYDLLIFGEMMYEGSPSYKVALYQPSGSQLNYVLKKIR